MFFEGSGTFEQFPAKHLLGILKNRSRKTTKKDYNVYYNFGTLLCFLVVCNHLIEDELLVISPGPQDTKGAFTRQRKNGTDPTKTGTVPIVFLKKQWTFIRSVSGP